MEDKEGKIEPVCFTVNEFLAWARISRHSLYREINRGKLTTRKLGKRTLIEREEAERWFNSLPTSRDAA